MKTKKRFKPFWYWSLLALLIAPGTSLSENINDEDKALYDILPGKTDELCMTLTPQESLEYSFEATGALLFNIHYHLAHRSFYPVHQKLASKEKGGFSPNSKQRYCLTWHNANRHPVAIKVEHKKIPRTQ